MRSRDDQKCRCSHKYRNKRGVLKPTLLASLLRAACFEVGIKKTASQPHLHGCSCRKGRGPPARRDPPGTASRVTAPPAERSPAARARPAVSSQPEPAAGPDPFPCPGSRYARLPAPAGPRGGRPPATPGSRSGLPAVGRPTGPSLRGGGEGVTLLRPSPPRPRRPEWGGGEGRAGPPGPRSPPPPPEPSLTPARSPAGGGQARPARRGTAALRPRPLPHTGRTAAALRRRSPQPGARQPRLPPPKERGTEPSRPPRPGSASRSGGRPPPAAPRSHRAAAGRLPLPLRPPPQPPAALPAATPGRSAAHAGQRRGPASGARPATARSSRLAGAGLVAGRAGAGLARLPSRLDPRRGRRCARGSHFVVARPRGGGRPGAAWLCGVWAFSRVFLRNDSQSGAGPSPRRCRRPAWPRLPALPFAPEGRHSGGPWLWCLPGAGRSSHV